MEVLTDADGWILIGIVEVEYEFRKLFFHGQIAMANISEQF